MEDRREVVETEAEQGADEVVVSPYVEEAQRRYADGIRRRSRSRSE